MYYLFVLQTLEIWTDKNSRFIKRRKASHALGLICDTKHIYEELS